MKFEVLRNFVKNYKLEESRNFHHSTLFSSNPFLNQHKLNIYENIIVNIIKLNVDKKTFILCLKKLNTAIQIIFHFNLNSNIQPYTLHYALLNAEIIHLRITQSYPKN